MKLIATSPRETTNGWSVRVGGWGDGAGCVGGVARRWRLGRTRLIDCDDHAHARGMTSPLAGIVTRTSVACELLSVRPHDTPFVRRPTHLPRHGTKEGSQ